MKFPGLTSRQRLLLVFFSIPVSIFGNVLMITITGLLAYYLSTLPAEGYLHTQAWIGALVLSFICLIPGRAAIQWLERKRMQYISWFLR